MRYDGPPILRNDEPGLRDLRRVLVAIGVVVALVTAGRVDLTWAIYTGALLLVYLGSRK